jgi:CcmD family protein
MALALLMFPLVRPDDRYRHTVLILIFLLGIMAVTLIIWVGLFGYVYRVDRKVRRLED